MIMTAKIRHYVHYVQNIGVDSGVGVGVGVGMGGGDYNQGRL